MSEANGGATEANGVSNGREPELARGSQRVLRDSSLSGVRRAKRLRAKLASQGFGVKPRDDTKNFFKKVIDKLDGF